MRCSHIQAHLKGLFLQRLNISCTLLLNFTESVYLCAQLFLLMDLQHFLFDWHHYHGKLKILKFHLHFFDILSCLLKGIILHPTVPYPIYVVVGLRAFFFQCCEAGHNFLKLILSMLYLFKRICRNYLCIQVCDFDPQLLNNIANFLQSNFQLLVLLKFYLWDGRHDFFHCSLQPCGLLYYLISFLP